MLRSALMKNTSEANHRFTPCVADSNTRCTNLCDTSEGDWQNTQSLAHSAPRCFSLGRCIRSRETVVTGYPSLTPSWTCLPMTMEQNCPVVTAYCLPVGSDAIIPVTTNYKSKLPGYR